MKEYDQHEWSKRSYALKSFIFDIFIYLFLPKVYADMLVLLIFYIQRTIHEHLHAGIWTELTQTSRK